MRLIDELLDGEVPVHSSIVALMRMLYQSGVISAAKLDWRDATYFCRRNHKQRVQSYDKKI